MTLARTTSINLLGLKGEPIEIEVDVSNGLPAYSLLGLPDATLSESRDRIRAAIINSGRNWPNRKVTVSLSPAWLPKSGSAFDLPIALSILTASGQLKESDLSKAFFLGELSLEGNLRPVRGVLPTLIAARDRGVKRVIVPRENFQEAGLLKDLEVLAFSKLSHVISFLESGVRAENPILIDVPKEVAKHDMSEVAGHAENKVALEIAAAGGHNLLMIGAPGSGKTMLAERFSTILPRLDEDEAIEVSGIHSIAGTLKERNVLSTEPPFIAPHHSTTIPALVGGGSSSIKPGACSLAHRGVLFIDEAPECDSGILDALRQPMESGSVTISRSALTASFPARFILLLAANPCPCGRFAGRGRSCQCTSLQVRRYLAKLSGPLLDRVDIRLRVESPTRVELSTSNAERSESIRIRVMRARAIAAERFAQQSFKLNSQIPPSLLRERFRPSKDGMAILHALLDKEELSARGFHRTIRLSWSIADMSGVKTPGKNEVERALILRSGMPGE
jgi:magnesium chelatase family protein